ncbi:DUF1289 domain-containing protein [Planctobacterium marinum]|uniref:DUF1289 domain-containing protein n=1 Tax=Planctobacterium marinum TaxID=1631968 RepID=UPI0030C66270
MVKKPINRPIDPCQAVCRFNEDDVCIGCFRERDEINNWRFMSNEQKATIVERVKPEIKARLEEEKRQGRMPANQRFRY